MKTKWTAFALSVVTLLIVYFGLIPAAWKTKVLDSDRPSYGNIRPLREQVEITYPWHAIGASRSYIGISECSENDAVSFMDLNELGHAPQYQPIQLGNNPEFAWFQQELDEQKRFSRTSGFGGHSTHNLPKILASYYGGKLFVYLYQQTGNP